MLFFFRCIRFNQTKSPRDQVAMDEIEDRLRRKVRISSFFLYLFTSIHWTYCIFLMECNLCVLDLIIFFKFLGYNERWLW